MYNANQKIIQYFNQNNDIDHFAYILEQRSQTKHELNDMFFSVVSLLIPIIGVTDLVKNAITNYGLIPILIFAIIVIDVYVCFFLASGQINYRTWKLLSEDANLVKIEREKESHC